MNKSTKLRKSDVRIDFINFVEPPDESISYPMGIIFISSYLKKHDFTNIGFTDHICLQRKIAEKELDIPTLRPYLKQHYLMLNEENPNIIIAYLKERQPHIILLGPITTYFLIELGPLVKTLRERFTEQIIIAGGPHFGKEPSLDNELMQKYPELDGIVVGEAEETITEVANRYFSAYKRKRTCPNRTDFLNDLSQTPGILTRINDLQKRDSLNLNTLPAPDIELIEEYWRSQHVTMKYLYSLSHRRNPIIYTDRGYFRGESNWGYIEEDFHRFPQYSFKGPFPFGVIVGSRGCPYNGAFCCSSGQRRTHSAQEIYEQIRYLKNRYKVNTFVFFESLFTTASLSEQKRTHNLCRMLLDSHIDIDYIIDIRADIVSELPNDLLALMIQSGCTEFNIGFEKGSNQALARVNKGTRIEHHRIAVKKLREIARKVEREIFINGTFILGGPGETKDDIKDTIHHSWSLHLDETTFYVMQIYPGTKVYKDALNEGVIVQGLAPYLNAEEFPLYSTENLQLYYLNLIERLNDDSRRAFNEFKKTVRELEYELTSEERRVLSNLMLKETDELYEPFLNLVDIMLDTKFPKKELLVGGEETDDFKKCVLRVEEEIKRAEERLIQRYPDNYEHMSNYQLGTLSRSLKHFIKSYGDLLNYGNYS